MADTTANTPFMRLPASNTLVVSPTLSFAHIQVGQSEVYLDVEVTAGNTVTATLIGPGITSSTVQTAVSGSSGEVRLTWTIDQFGEYSITGTAGPTPISVSATVE